MFITGKMKTVIKLVMVHETILTDLNLDDQVKATRALMSAKKKGLAHLSKPQSQASTMDKDALKVSIKGLEGSLVSLQAEAFDHFEKLLCPTVQLQWKDIVKGKCDGDTYISLLDVVSGVICGRNLSAIKPCYMHFVKLSGPQESAERIQRYMATNISIDINTVSVRQGIGRM